jgi:ADP-heptose:LPS heptosyltransferase
VFTFKADIVILPKGHPAFTETMLVIISRARIRIGLDHPGHSALLTHPIPHEFTSEHRAISALRLLAPFGVDDSKLDDHLVIGKPPEIEAEADKAFAGWGGDSKWVTVNISAGDRRWWAAEKWKALIIALHEDPLADYRFLLVSAPHHADRCDAIVKELPYCVTYRTDDFLTATALIARTEMLFSCDTGTVHSASARGIPVFALYNGDWGNYERFTPWRVPHYAVHAPTDLPTEVIPVEEVVKGAREFVKKLIRQLIRRETDKLVKKLKG